MRRYIIKRLLTTVVVIIAVAVVIFTILYFTPGEPASILLGPTATQEEIDYMNKTLGLDRPYIVRLGDFLYQTFLKFDLGKSYISQTPVIDEVVNRFPRTCMLALFSMVSSALIGIPVGVYAAVHQNRIGDKVTLLLTIVLHCVPNFWLALLMILLFSVKLNWLPSFGIGSWKHYVIPCLSIILSGFTGIARQTRSSMLEVIRSDYVVTARAQGYSERNVIYKHALPNAMIPVITILGTNFASALGGTLIIETIFAIPGMGMYVQSGITNRDYPVVQGVVVLLSITFCLVMVLIDIIYAYVDPRIKAQYENAAMVKKGKHREKGSDNG